MPSKGPRAAKKRAIDSNQGTRKSPRLMAREPSQTHILELPDEMLHEIFNKLNSEERAPLGLVCKRFRNADFALGHKEFEHIGIYWYPTEQSLSGKVPGYCYEIRGNEKKPIEATPQNLGLFKKAKTKILDIEYAKQTGADFDLIYSFCKSVTFDILNVVSIAQSSADNFVVELLRGRDLSKAQVYLRYESGNATHDVATTRRQLLQLPKVKNFKLDWLFLNTHPKPYKPCNVLDNATLLHVIENTEHAELDRGDFTVQGLLDAFEAVCNSSMQHKHVKFYVSATSPDVIEELFDLPDLKFEVDELRGFTQLRLVDRNRGASLEVSTNYGSHLVQMGKIDERGHFMSGRVRW